jgi:SAM-dependent methyltransferase
MQTEEYLKLAAVEDQMWYFRALHRHVGRELARAFPAAASGVEVLDAGCGTGGLILALRRIRPEMTFAGLDYSELACRLARERTDATITQGSITELPYPDQSFNAVISADVICQVEEPVQALREFKRVLRPGGTVIINVPALRWLWSYHDDSCQTQHRFTRRELQEAFRQAGLEPGYVTYRNFVVFPLIAAKRKLLPSGPGASDVRLYARPVEACFNGLMALEHAWMRRRWRLPIGTSVFGVARRQN